MTVLCNQDDILNAHATNALVTLEHLLVDVLRVAHRSEEVWREVDARLNGLHGTVNYPFKVGTIQSENTLTTTMPSSSGSRRRKYV